MKHTKRLLLASLAVTTLLAFVACSTSDDDTDDNGNDTQSNQPTSEDNTAAAEQNNDSNIASTNTDTATATAILPASVGTNELAGMIIEETATSGATYRYSFSDTEMSYLVKSADATDFTKYIVFDYTYNGDEKYLSFKRKINYINGEACSTAAAFVAAAAFPSPLASAYWDMQYAKYSRYSYAIDTEAKKFKMQMLRADFGTYLNNGFGGTADSCEVRVYPNWGRITDTAADTAVTYFFVPIFDDNRISGTLYKSVSTSQNTDVFYSGKFQQQYFDSMLITATEEIGTFSGTFVVVYENRKYTATLTLSSVPESLGRIKDTALALTESGISFPSAGSASIAIVSD